MDQDISSYFSDAGKSACSKHETLMNALPHDDVRTARLLMDHGARPRDRLAHSALVEVVQGHMDRELV